VASLSQGRTAAAQCGLFTYKSVPVIFEPPCIFNVIKYYVIELAFCVNANSFTVYKSSLDKDAFLKGKFAVLRTSNGHISSFAH